MHCHHDKFLSSLRNVNRIQIMQKLTWRVCAIVRIERAFGNMTQHQYGIVKWLRRVWFLKRFFGNDWAQGIVTKQAEIELAGQAAAKNCPPIQDNAGAITEKS